eukprot:1394901-Rhodomonas_salina.1
MQRSYIPNSDHRETQPPWNHERAMPYLLTSRGDYLAHAHALRRDQTSPTQGTRPHRGPSGP